MIKLGRTDPPSGVLVERCTMVNMVTRTTGDGVPGKEVPVPREDGTRWMVNLRYTTHPRVLPRN